VCVCERERVCVQRDKAQEEAVEVSLVSRFRIVIYTDDITFIIQQFSSSAYSSSSHVSLPASHTPFILRQTIFHVQPMLFFV